MIKLWAKRGRIKIKTTHKGYLYRSVYNGFVNEYMKGQQKGQFLVNDHIEVVNNFFDQNDDALTEKLKLLNQAIEELPPRCKEVFLMSKKLGYLYKEIAIQLDITESNVENHISRAFKQIKKIVRSKGSQIFYLHFNQKLSQK